MSQWSATAWVGKLKRIKIFNYSRLKFYQLTGAHIAGRAAKQLKSEGKIANIIGLDPASVGFDFFERNKRLADSDADFVQVIHTDGDKFGFANPLGHGTCTTTIKLSYSIYILRIDYYI